MVQAPAENSRLKLFHDTSLTYHRKISTHKFYNYGIIMVEMQTVYLILIKFLWIIKKNSFNNFKIFIDKQNHLIDHFQDSAKSVATFPKKKENTLI